MPKISYYEVDGALSANLLELAAKYGPVHEIEADIWQGDCPFLCSYLPICSCAKPAMPPAHRSSGLWAD